MVSNSPGSAIGSQEKHGGGSSNTRQTLGNKINLLKKQIQKERVESIKEKIQRNGKNLKCQLSEVMMVFEEHDLTEEVLSIVSDIIGDTSSEIKERYEHIKEKERRKSEDYGESGSHTEIRLNKSLSETLDGFDHLLCRQCMIFDCSVHGCSQKFIYPNEKQNVWSEPEDDGKPCGDYCHLNNIDATISDSTRGLNLDAACNEEQHVMDETELNQMSNSMEGQIEEDSSVSDWKPLEVELYQKGKEMFGRNSCLISRNLLAGLRTCEEVARYMYVEASMPHGSMEENGQFDAMSTDNNTPSRPRKGIKENISSIHLVSGYFCEKYCGCSMLCRNRFGGCHCNKTHCRSRHCPCFAALHQSSHYTHTDFQHYPPKSNPKKQKQTQIFQIHTTARPTKQY
ncbi:histone-lysine N-methyltransferase EZA1 [Trifolium repens]|nr:histone-lysine N-methyltransferase EZA1 [Trifolium repens]